MADTGQSLYRTLPIPSNGKYVRLLHVRRPISKANVAEPIQCSLSVDELHRERYCALSYVWGTTRDPPDTIDCSGFNIPVSTNCLSALRRLRSDLEEFVIWVDAVCIDQNNDDEKAQQIPMMKDVFMSANTTYIWLGEGDSTKTRAIEYISRAGLLEYYFNLDHDESGIPIRPRPWAAARHYIKNRLTFDKCLIPTLKGMFAT